MDNHPAGRVHFPGLNGIRAVAALLVVLHHIELYKLRERTPSLHATFLATFVSNAGENGVFVFFVLSGFLITYLLLREKADFGRIDFRRFYLRRICRIWPLYYLVVLFSFFVLPPLARALQPLREEAFYFSKVQALDQSFAAPLALFLFFLPNLALRLYPPVVGCAQAWSVGAEEQFYLVWPQLIARMKRTWLALAFITIALMPIWGASSRGIQALVAALPVHFMATGGLAALWLAERPGYRSRASVRLVACTGALLGLFFPFDRIAFGALVAFAIVNIATGHYAHQSRLMNRLGVISYGIYMYHPLVMYFSFAWLNHYGPPDRGSPLYNLSLYTLVVGLTLVLSHFSYELLEKRFISYKNRKLTLVATDAS